MNRDMLLLAERLVMAMETMSQDVKNMSAYVYDLSCSVSYLLNEKREKECISLVSDDEGDNPPSVTSASGQEAFAERVYSGQYEQADERSASHTGDLEHGESSFGDIASSNIQANKKSGAPESDPVFTGRIKIEALPAVEENNESRDVDNIYGDSGNNVGISKEMKSEIQSETERENQAYSLLTSISHSMGQLMPSESIERVGLASDPPRDIQSMETSSNFAANSDRVAFVSGPPERQMSVSRIHQRQIAEDTLMAHMSADSEERPYKCLMCGKSFKSRVNLRIHIRVHSGEKPYSCNVCGNAFRQRHHLTVHMRSHTGESPYKCNVCGKAFRHSPSLKQHMHTH